MCVCVCVFYAMRLACGWRQPPGFRKMTSLNSGNPGGAARYLGSTLVASQADANSLRTPANREPVKWWRPPILSPASAGHQTDVGHASFPTLPVSLPSDDDLSCASPARVGRPPGCLGSSNGWRQFKTLAPAPMSRTHGPTTDGNSMLKFAK